MAMPVFAQQVPPDAAFAEAQARVACGDAALVSARYIPGGGIQVTCSRTGRAESALTGTALGGTGVAAGLFGVLLLGGLAGGGGGGASTTTSSTTTSSTTSSTTTGTR